ncbi:MAG: N-acetylmuramoyl-L-alanine amidase [Clostridia bacterium]|nr:N-acetylmuramoyl-L-alanine amidase [Clostridia bacterium]
MEKLKKIIFNVIFYITVIAIIVAVFLVMMFVVMKLNVSAMSGISQGACVLIDPGHGAEDGGAESEDGVIEKDVNLSIALMLRDYLELSGCKVIMTRDDDEIPGQGETLKDKLHDDFVSRLSMFNDSDVDIVVSIHQNKFTDPQYSGAQVFYSPNDPNSEHLAVCVRRAFRGLLQPDNDRDIVKAGSNIYLLNNCNKPSILVECGFLSNPEEAHLLASEDYQRQAAFAIGCGIIEYLDAQK